jgi:hypothetical protein
MSRRNFFPILLVFVLGCLLFLAGRASLAGWNMDYRVLIGGNAVLFLATGLSLLLYRRALRSSQIHAFIRVVYGSLLIKMFFCIVATLIYLWMVGRAASKWSIIGCFVLYILYTYLEVKVLIQLNKKSSPNA